MWRLAAWMISITLATAGCDTNTEDAVVVQPAVNLGVGVGSGGVHTYGGVGLFRGPVSVYLGF